MSMSYPTPMISDALLPTDDGNASDNKKTRSFEKTHPSINQAVSSTPAKSFIEPKNCQ